MFEPESGGWTIKHYNATTGRWHVEEGTTGVVWTTDKRTATSLAEGYRYMGYDSVVLHASDLAGVENLPLNGSLVEVDN